MWAELSLFSSQSCSEMLAGSADDWDGYETFHPETEVCAARVVQPVLEELQVVSLPPSLDTKAQEGKVLKVNRPHLSKLPNILGGRDGCQVCQRNVCRGTDSVFREILGALSGGGGRAATVRREQYR